MASNQPATSRARYLAARELVQMIQAARAEAQAAADKTAAAHDGLARIAASVTGRAVGDVIPGKTSAGGRPCMFRIQRVKVTPSESAHGVLVAWYDGVKLNAGGEDSRIAAYHHEQVIL